MTATVATEGIRMRVPRGSRRATAARALTAALAIALAWWVAAAICPAPRAWAADVIDLGRTGSLTVTYRDDEAAVSGAEVELRRVADVSATGAFTWVDGYAGYGLSLDAEDTAAWRSIAQTLAAYAARDGLPSDALGVTNAAGEVSFVSLQPGMYLVTGALVELFGMRYTPEPALVAVPQFAEGGGWAYDVEAVLKFSSEQLPPAPEQTSVSVQKLWLDDASTDRPVQVTVQLLRDGAVADERVLTAQNGWAHTWDGLDAGAVWTVVETAVPDGYTATVRRVGDVFVIENRADAAEPSPDPDDPGAPQEPASPEGPDEPEEPAESDFPPFLGELPHTGVSYAVIVPLAVSGALLAVIGWRRDRAARARGGER